MPTRELIYIYDALCGWCYGFSPVMQQLHEKYGGQLTFTVVSGGLALGDRVLPIGGMASYILESIPTVEMSTGVKFGEAYKALLREGAYMQNSEPPAIALAVVKAKYPERALGFAHALQQAMFLHGKSLNDPKTYEELAYQQDLPSPAQFVDDMAMITYADKAREDFMYAARLGATGFPTVIFRDGNKKNPKTGHDQYWQLSRGYRDYAYLDRALEELIPS